MNLSADPLLAPARGPVVDPRFQFTVTVPPERFVASAGSGWDGALFTEGAARPSGEARHDHEVVMIQRWLTPNEARPLTGPGSWAIDPPGTRVCLPGDPEYAEWRGHPRSQFLFIAPERVEALLEKPWDASGLTRWRERRHGLPFVDHVLSAMKDDMEAGYPAGPLTGDALLVALVSFLDARAVEGASPRRGALGRRLEVVLEYIEANLARPLSLTELASLAGVGVRRFGSIFAAETGWSPHRYVLNRRVERAKKLMEDPELSLAEIALATGFGGPSRFSRVFRQFTGEPPRTYRRR